MVSDSEDTDEEDIITFHMICHSHQDVGWLLTYQEYYNKHSKPILTGVFKALLADP